MKVIIYSKEGCQYCDHAVDLCETEGLEYEKVMIDKEKLKEICGGPVTTYPQIFIDDRRVGTYFEFQDYIEEEYEPILAPTLNRFTVFPLKYPHLWDLYKKAQMSNWTAEEVDFSKDMEDWKTEDIAERISQKWDFPIYLQNDASAACGAELVFGAQDRPRDFLYFFIGFFIGGGLVLDDSLYTGKTGNAAAMGPLPIRKSNGTTISLMDLASLVRLEQAVIEAGGIAETIWENTQNWDIDPALVDTWITATVSALVEGIIAASCIIDFECVMVEGWLPEDIRARIVAGVNAKLQGVVAPGIDLPTARAGTIGSDARALGGASLPLSDRFLIDRHGFVNH